MRRLHVRMSDDIEELKARLRWWLKGWLRAYQESTRIDRIGKAAVRCMAAGARSQSLVP